MFRKAVTLTFSLLAAAVFNTAASANDLRTFHLPVETHWGNVVLEPGNYSLSLPSGTNPASYVQITGANKTVFILVATTKIGPETKKSYLSLVQIDGIPVVSELHSNDTGRTFIFPTPKHFAREIASSKNGGASVTDFKDIGNGVITVQ